MKFNEDILLAFVNDPNDKYKLLDVAEEYMRLEQWTSAQTYFMKCAESCSETDYDLKYHCLLSISWIFHKLGNRWLGAMQYARFAKAECPDRVEAYYMLSMITAEYMYAKGIYEQDQWISVYENAKIGSIFLRANKYTPVVGRYYAGDDMMYIYYCISLLRINKHDELLDFLNSYYPSNDASNEVIDTLVYIYDQLGLPCPHTKLDRNTLAPKYIDQLDQYNDSQSYARAAEDLFCIFNSIKKTYIEITDLDPIKDNASLYLERFGWKGVTIYNSQEMCNKHILSRDNKCLNLYPLVMDFDKLITDMRFESNNIGSLIINYNPEQSVELLRQILKSSVRFETITVKHDAYLYGRDIQDKIYMLLTEAGYYLSNNNVRFNNTDDFEDWYVNHPIEEVKGNKLGIKFFTE
jgi:hypothetical protein